MVYIIYNLNECKCKVNMNLRLNSKYHLVFDNYSSLNIFRKLWAYIKIFVIKILKFNLLNKGFTYTLWLNNFDYYLNSYKYKKRLIKFYWKILFVKY